MVGNYDLHYLRIASAKSLTHPGNLIFVYASALDRQRARRVNTHHRNLVVIIKRPEIVSDVALIFAKWLQKARVDIMQRNIMIAWDYNLWFGQPIEKRAC